MVRLSTKQRELFDSSKDCAPRVFLMLAKMWRISKASDRDFGKLLVRAAEILSGDVMSRSEAETALGRMCSRERRGVVMRQEKCQQSGTWIAKPIEDGPRDRLCASDERHLQRLVERGHLPDRPIVGE